MKAVEAVARALTSTSLRCWRYFGLAADTVDPSNSLHVAGSTLFALGTVLLIACIVQFARSGRGTLSPLDPPRQLVVRGLYRYVRNPMYLSVAMVVLGEGLLTGSRALLMYWVLWLAAVHAFVIGYEEPTLQRQFGDSYAQYRRQVRRWVPRPHAHEAF